MKREGNRALETKERAQSDDRMTDRNIHLHLEGHVKRNWSMYTQYVFGVDPSTNVILNCGTYLYTLVVRHCNEQALYSLLCLYTIVYFCYFMQL